MILQDINAVYKKMALELHPDKGGDPEKFQELQEMKECALVKDCYLSYLCDHVEHVVLFK